MQEYIHYGPTQFDPAAFQPIQNRLHTNKPYGGLWASAVDAKFGWKKWCKDAEFDFCFTSSFRFHLHPNARVYVVDSSEKAKRMPQREKSARELGIEITFPVLPDFERIAKDYDVIDFRISDDRSLYHTLYGWDCDSVLILNPNVIEIETAKIA